jgi:hypothetical protein
MSDVFNSASTSGNPSHHESARVNDAIHNRLLLYYYDYYYYYYYYYYYDSAR